MSDVSPSLCPLLPAEKKWEDRIRDRERWGLRGPGGVTDEQKETRYRGAEGGVRGQRADQGAWID